MNNHKIEIKARPQSALYQRSDKTQSAYIDTARKVGPAYPAPYPGWGFGTGQVGFVVLLTQGGVLVQGK